jgi:hypothetical protein
MSVNIERTGLQPVFEDSPLDNENGYNAKVLIGYQLIGQWPAEVSDRLIRDVGGKVRVGTTVNLPPYRVRLIDYDPMCRCFTAVPARPSWRWFALKLAASKRWVTFKIRVQATLAVWGLAKWPSGW